LTQLAQASHQRPPLPHAEVDVPAMHWPDWLSQQPASHAGLQPFDTQRYWPPLWTQYCCKLH
jgi:hypothetical protein